MLGKIFSLILTVKNIFNLEFTYLFLEKRKTENN